MTSPSDTTEPKFGDYPLYVGDVAKMLNFHPQYVRFLAKKGKIPGVKVCGAWRFNETELTESLICYENSPVIKVNRDKNI